MCRAVGAIIMQKVVVLTMNDGAGDDLTAISRADAQSSTNTVRKLSGVLTRVSFTEDFTNIELRCGRSP